MRKDFKFYDPLQLPEETTVRGGAKRKAEEVDTKKPPKRKRSLVTNRKPAKTGDAEVIPSCTHAHEII